MLMRSPPNGKVVFIFLEYSDERVPVCLLDGRTDATEMDARAWVGRLNRAVFGDNAGLKGPRKEDPGGEAHLFYLDGEWECDWGRIETSAEGRIWTLGLGMGPDEERCVQPFGKEPFEALERLSAHVSHDLYNFMTAVLGAASLLRRRLAEDDHRLNHVKQLESAIGSSRKKFLAISLLSEGLEADDEQKPVAPVVTQALRTLRGSYPSLEVQWEEPGFFSGVQAHLEALQYVIHAILENGCQGCGERQPLKVSLALEEGHEMVIRVTSVGGQLSPQALRFAFKPTFSGWVRARKGMGLPVSWVLVRRMGGSLDLSQGEEGVVCTLRLPAAPSIPKKEQGLGRAKGPSARQLLLVEADGTMRKVHKIAAEGEGWMVHEASFGQASVVLCRALPGQLAAVLCDLDSLEQPLGEWLGLTRQYQKEAVVLFFCNEGLEVSPQWEEFGVTEVNFLRKPFSPADLMNSISELQGKH